MDPVITKKFILSILKLNRESKDSLTFFVVKKSAGEREGHEGNGFSSIPD